MSEGDDLYWAARRGDLAEVQRCLNNGAYVNGKQSYGDTPLHEASFNGHVDVVKCLVERGANVHATDHDGRTSLHLAILNAQVDVVKCLVERGANVDATDNDGYMSIHLASMKGRLDVVKFLLEKGANVNASNKEGWTPLHLASELCRVDVVKFLVERGANVDATNKNGNTPLHLASKYGHLKLVEILLAAGADLFAINKDGQTPRDVAAAKNHSAIVDLLDQCAKDRALSYFCAGDHAMAEKHAALVVTTLKLNKSAFAWIGDTFHQQHKYKEATAAFEIGYDKDPIDGGCALGLVDVPLTVQVAELFKQAGAVLKLADSEDPSFGTFLKCAESMAILRSVVDNPTLYHHHKPLLKPVFKYLKSLANEVVVPPAPQPQPSPAPFHRNIATLVDLAEHLKSFPAAKTWPLMGSFVLLNRPLTTDNHPIFECVNGEQKTLELVVKLTDERRELEFCKEVWASQELKWLKADTHLVRCVKWGVVTIESRKCFALVLLRGEANCLNLLRWFQFTSVGRPNRYTCLKKIVAAVKFLHDNGYVHGDIKLENVMQVFFGELDFKLIDFDNTVRIKSHFKAHCSPEYCPPEMARRMRSNHGLQPLNAHPSFDVWCVGVLVLKLFVPMGLLVEFDRLPWQDIIEKIATTGFTFNDSLARVEGLGPAQVQVLKKCLAVDPTHRATLKSILGLVPPAFITQEQSSTPGASQATSVAAPSSIVPSNAVLPPPSTLPATTLATTSSHPIFPCIWVSESTNTANTRFRLSCLCELGSDACAVTSQTAPIELDLQSDLLRGMLPVLQTSWSLLMCLLFLQNDGVACREFFSCPPKGVTTFMTALNTILQKYPDATSSTTLSEEDQSQLKGLKTALESSTQTEAQAADKWSQLKRLIVQHSHAEATRSALVGLQGPAFDNLQKAAFPLLGTRWVCAAHLPAP